MTDEQKTGSLFRLDMTNVTKRCEVCQRTVVTGYGRVAICAQCRYDKHLAGDDEVAELEEALEKAYHAADRYYAELEELERFHCPCCSMDVWPGATAEAKEHSDNGFAHDEDCELIETVRAARQRKPV